MISQNYRVFEIDGTKYSFSPVKFKEAMSNFQGILRDEGKAYLLKDVSLYLSEQLSISEDALKKWRQGYNGPSDLDRIKEIASALKCDFIDLLTEVGGKKTLEIRESDYQSINSSDEAIRSIICDLLDIIESFGETKGYCVVPNKKNLLVSEGNEDSAESTCFEPEPLFESIRVKIRKLSFFINRDEYQKLDRLFFETKAFVDWGLLCRPISRWEKISKGFESLFYLEDSVLDEYLEAIDFFGISKSEYVPDDMREWLQNEFSDYLQRDYGYSDNVMMLFANKIGEWYMQVIRADFPYLFVD